VHPEAPTTAADGVAVPVAQHRASVVPGAEEGGGNAEGVRQPVVLVLVPAEVPVPDVEEVAQRSGGLGRDELRVGVASDDLRELEEKPMTLPNALGRGQAAVRAALSPLLNPPSPRSAGSSLMRTCCSTRGRTSSASRSA
jgi:hypothetical protein